MRFRRFVSLLLLAAYLPACTAYHPTSASVMELTAAPKPVERMRVTKQDGSQVEIWEPRVALDSVIGMNNRAGRATGRVAVALADVRMVDVRAFDTPRTVGLVAAFAAAVAVLALVTEPSGSLLGDGTIDIVP